MKKHFSVFALAGVLALALTVSASAADEGGIAVQLDGTKLTFTDAAPQVKEQRTFLPFRAVFEAMGAEVSYSASDSTVTAHRGNTTVTMTLGGDIALVEKDGVKSEVVMDVAPFAEGGRTYVPVRFAAQAMGCGVGWDQDNSTVVLVDTGKLLAEAKEGKEYTWLEKFMDYSMKYQEGIWDCTLNLDGSATILGLPMTIGGSADATVDGSTKMEMDMNMTMDMTDLLASMQEAAAAQGQEAAATPEEEAMFETLATDGIDMALRADMETGLCYMNMGGEFVTAAGIDPDTWYSMDLNATYQQIGIDFAQLMTLVNSDYSCYIQAIIEAGLQATDMNDVNAYAGMVEAARELAGIFADDRFVKNGNDYTCTYRMDEDNASAELVLTLNTKNDAVVGYAFKMGMYTPADAARQIPATSVELSTSMDAKNKMTAQVTLDLGTLAIMDMAMTGGYTNGTTAPQTEPPAGATVVPYESLIAMPE